MKLGEAEGVLPNGLHDAQLLRFSVDYQARTAEFEFNAWVGDLSANLAEREQHRQVKLFVSGLRFLILEKPDPTYDFQDGAPTIEGFSAWGGEIVPPDDIRKLTEKLAATAFYERTFVDDWNSFIHIGADHAEIKFIER